LIFVKITDTSKHVMYEYDRLRTPPVRMYETKPRMFSYINFHSYSHFGHKQHRIVTA
jgi:hypothetical protein